MKIDLTDLDKIIAFHEFDIKNARSLMEHYKRISKDLKTLLYDRSVESRYYISILRNLKVQSETKLDNTTSSNLEKYVMEEKKKQIVEETKKEIKELKYGRKEELRRPNIKVRLFLGLLREIRSELYHVMAKYTPQTGGNGKKADYVVVGEPIEIGERAKLEREFAGHTLLD